MKKIFLTTVYIALTAVGCNKRSEEVGPRINEGYYGVQGQVTNENVSLVAFKPGPDETKAYSFYWQNCEQSVVGSYSRTATTLGSDRPASSSGPNVTYLTSNCSIKSNISANSETTIQITNTLNGVAQQPYLLTKITQQEFINRLKESAEQIENFKAVEEDCLDSLGETCKAMDIKSKK